MNKILLSIVCFLMLTSTALARDIFIGTFEIRDNIPVLVRCDLAKNTYVLKDTNGDTQVWVAYLEKAGVVPGKEFMGDVIGDAEMTDTELFLIVDSIDNIREGTCHLGSLFKE